MQWTCGPDSRLAVTFCYLNSGTTLRCIVMKRNPLQAFALQKYRKIDVASPASQLVWAWMMSYTDDMLLLLTIFSTTIIVFTICVNCPVVDTCLFTLRSVGFRSADNKPACTFFVLYLLIGNSAAVCLTLANSSWEWSTCGHSRTMMKLQCDINLITVSSVILLCLYFCSYVPVP